MQAWPRSEFARLAERIAAVESRGEFTTGMVDKAISLEGCDVRRMREELRDRRRSANGKKLQTSSVLEFLNEWDDEETQEGTPRRGLAGARLDSIARRFHAYCESTVCRHLATE